MVDLPKIPRRFVTTETPKSLVSAADIAQPYADFGKALNNMGDALGDVAKVEAENAAQNAVTRDADGNISVSLMPDYTGAAGRSYNRIAKQKFLLDFEQDAKNKLTEKQVEFDGKPAEFKAWADTFRDQSIAREPNNEIAEAKRQVLDKYADQAHRGLLLKAHHTDIVRANEAVNSKLLTLADDVERLSRQGAPKEVIQSTIGEFDNLLNEKVGNPLLAYPKEKADRFRDEMLTRAHTGAILEGVERVYSKPFDQGGGFQAARKHLADSVAELGATIKDSGKIQRAGEAWLNSQEKALQADRAAVSKEWDAARPQLATLSPDALDDLEERASSAGAWRVASDIRQRRAALDISGQILRLPQSEQLKILGTGGRQVGGPLGDMINEEAASAGVPGDLMRRMAMIEASGDPNAVTGSYKGLFQLSRAEFEKYGGGNIFDARDNTRAAARKLAAEIAEFKTSYGRDPTATEIYLQHQQGVAGTKAHLSNPERPAWENMLSTGEGKQKGAAWAKAAIWGNIPDTIKGRFPGGVESVSSADFIEIWRGKVEGGARSEVASPLTGPTRNDYSATANRRLQAPQGVDLSQDRAGLLALGEVRKHLQADLKDRLTAFASADRKMEIPSLDEMEAIAGEVGFLGTPEQKRQVAELAAQAEYGAEFRALSAPKREEVIAAWDARLAEGGSKFERELKGKLDHAHKAITDEYKRDPFGAYYQFGSQTKPLASLNFNDPAQMSAVLGEKMKQAGVIRASQDIPTFSAFRPAEAQAFRGFLANASAEQVAGAFQALSRLDDETLFETLSDKPVADGLRAVMRSTDPAKYTAVMSGLDGLYARGAEQTTKLVGIEGWHDLQTWQSNRRYMDEKTLAAERQRAADPQVDAVRKKNEETGHALALKKSVDKIVDGFDETWFSDPQAPVDQDTRDVFVGDYRNIYARRYAETLDGDQAHNQAIRGMKEIGGWGRSPLNGDRLMLRPPEAVYPAVDGGHDYLKAELETALAEKYGKRLDQLQPVLTDEELRTGKLVRSASWDYALRADRRTEAEALRYDKTKPVSATNKPPSYIVLVRDNTRTNPEWLPEQRRFSFDPGPAQEADRARRDIRRGRREHMMENINFNAIGGL